MINGIILAIFMFPVIWFSSNWHSLTVLVSLLTSFCAFDLALFFEQSSLKCRHFVTTQSNYVNENKKNSNQARVPTDWPTDWQPTDWPTNQLTDWRTNRQMDGQTDGQMKRIIEALCSCLKMKLEKIKKLYRFWIGWVRKSHVILFFIKFEIKWAHLRLSKSTCLRNDETLSFCTNSFFLFPRLVN
jgi:hypothetical protein